MITMPLSSRGCDVCGSTQLEPVWEQRTFPRNRVSRYDWSVRVVLCPVCGFCFVSPAPKADYLLEYYENGFTPFANQALDYSVAKRMDLLSCYATSGGVYVEIGSNNNNAEFFSNLLDYFSRVLTVEINNKSEPTAREIKEIPGGYADIVASYFVMEHIVKPGDFFDQCKSLIRHDGKIVIEVPDLRYYPTFSVGLLLHEHVNHFTPTTLEALAARHGLRMIESSVEACSRDYGFVAVFELGDVSVEYNGLEELNIARLSLVGGIDKINNYQRAIVQGREMIADAAARGDKAVIWGCNDNCLRLLEGMDLPDGVIVVDSDPRKATFLEAIPVMIPEKAAAHICQSSILILCTRRHAGSILDWISIHAASTAAPAVHVVDI